MKWTTLLLASALMAQTDPRSSPDDYMVKAKAGDITLAADFLFHSVPTLDGTFKSDSHVVVELAIYGQKTNIAFGQFSVRINGKKMPILAQPYGAALRGLSDPEWIPPKVEDDKNKRQPGDPPPQEPKMPFPLRREMELKVQKRVLPEGERTLPVAGLIFFPYRGKGEGIQSVELIYEGPAGTATLEFPL
ncbi:MAG: hypothetical protein NW208_07985 [Bryobacter sp.]|nr:hypothetical protein [Bryobacter sp.]